MKYLDISLRAVCISAFMISLAVSLVHAQPQKQTKPKGSIVPTELRCEYLINPLGIDELQPRLSWILQVKERTRGQKQTAYQIIVASSEKKLKADEGDLWDSGQIASSRSNQIEYNGRLLTSRRRCYWKVRIWDKDGAVSAWSGPAYWSMGLLQSSDWMAKWIGARPIILTGNEQRDSVARLMAPSPMLRKTFISNKRILRATMLVTALGLYEVHLNGRRVGDHVLAPEWTDYQDRIQYQTYDVTGLIATGDNVLSVMLADGWYVGAVGCFSDLVANRGKIYSSLDRRLLLQLEIENADGQTVHVVSDEGWRVNPDGPVRSADIYLGETYDSRKAPKGWERPGYDDARWEQASVYPSPSAALVAQMNEPVRTVEELKPLAVTEPTKGTYIFDMGQNMVGWCALKIDEPEGREITIRHGEMLSEDGRLYIENLRKATQTDKVIADGKGEQTYEPRFTYHGFRYVEITGVSRTPTLDVLVGKEVSSAVPATGSFECSNKDLNQLWKNILWTHRDNLIGVPTDCPQRDERLGWMADAQVFSQTAIYNCDMAAFYTKWVQDIRDAQHPDGRYPDVAPIPSYLPFYNAPAWADAGVIVPWRMYQNYGDTRLLRKHYASAKRFIDFVHSQNPNLIWTESVGNMYGDWLNGNTIVAEGYPKTGGQVPHCIFNTMHFALSTQILAEMAKVLGYDEDAQSYARLAAEIRSALLSEFVSKEGYMTTNTQAGYALALGFELLPENLRRKAVEHMLGSIADYDFRISTGFLSTIRMMHELVRWGHADIAYQLLESHRFPSWLYQIDQGATTVWERWDGYVKGRGFQDPGMNSFNHYAIGSVGEWMYAHILGIQREEKHPGFQEFVIHPQIGGSLTWARGKYHSIYGDIVTEWKVDNGVLALHVEIPPNAVAHVYVPTKNKSTIRETDLDAENAAGVAFIRMEGDAAVYELSSGSYDFVSEYSKKESQPFAVKPTIIHAQELDPGGNLKISIESPHPDGKTYYSLDGSEPATLYAGPFLIRQNTTVMAKTNKEGLRPSFPSMARFIFTDDGSTSRQFPNLILTHKAFGRRVEYAHPYSARHPGGGDAGLVNGKLATLDHVDLEWQGFDGADLEAVIDLGSVIPIHSLAVNFLHHQSARVFLPSKIEFLLSENGKDYQRVSTFENAIEKDPTAFIKTFKKDIQPKTGRYVKIVARNVGKCPEWHEEKGQNAWLAVDEIVIE